MRLQMYHPQPLLRAQQPALLHRKAAARAPKSSSQLALYLTTVVLLGCGAAQFLLSKRQKASECCAALANRGRSVPLTAPTS